MRTKDYRRHQENVRFKKRVEKWFSGNLTEKIVALSKKGYYFLKTTGSPCNCSMCQFEKYKRQQQQYIQKEIWEQISDE
jgi:hypothetical protein